MVPTKPGEADESGMLDTITQGVDSIQEQGYAEDHRAQTEQADAESQLFAMTELVEGLQRALTLSGEQLATRSDELAAAKEEVSEIDTSCSRRRATRC